MQSVLLLTNSHDGRNTDEVINRLQRFGCPYIRLDGDLLSRGLQILDVPGEPDHPLVLTTPDGTEADLKDVQSVWYRRPYEFDFRIQDPVQARAAEQETRVLMRSIWELLTPKFWISRPSAIAAAQLKPFQLQAARKAGLAVPSTLITNSANHARLFADAGPTIWKPLSAYELDYGSTFRSAFTTLLGEQDLQSLDLVRNAPALLQRYVAKRCEFRVTVVGHEVFSTRLDLPGYAEVVDWRTPEHNEQVTYSRTELPGDTSGQVLRLIDTLGLEFAAVDLALGVDGVLYFLEVNPIGQWLWIEDETGYPISSSIARRLITKE